jgi:hypothetical protein
MHGKQYEQLVILLMALPCSPINGTAAEFEKLEQGFSEL